MDRTERFYRIRRLLQARRLVPIEAFLADLEVSRATFKRDVAYLRERLNVPVVWDREAGGYRLETGHPGEELPGLWFSASEAHALLTMHQLLASIGPGVLDPHLEPIGQRLEKLLGSHGHAAAEVRQRVRLLHAIRRPVTSERFGIVAQALLDRRRLRVAHFNRATGETVERTLSPQRLGYYRDNWYLDAWCHLRNGLRSFAVDAITMAVVTPEPALDVAEAVLDRELATGYGIFSGAVVAWAQLRFSPARARWVAREQWHPQQTARFEADGGYHLSVPYSDARELVMDILKHGAEVEVLGPPALREAVREELGRALRRYEAAGGSSPEPGGP